MRYFAIVSYDGYNYYGYQKQKHNNMTIQEIIENKLSIIFKSHIEIYASGRTDKQVHAYAQTFHFDADIKIPLKNLKKALNELLPIDIKIKSIHHVKDDFHARFSSHKKEYIYKIINTDKIDPFKARYYAYIKDTIDIEKLKEASKLFIGIHDFKNFTTNKKEEVLDFKKEIFDVTVLKKKNEINIIFLGSGFLRYQVRMMVGALIVVATNKKDISFISNMLKDNVSERCSYKALANGLYLNKVIYK